MRSNGLWKTPSPHMSPCPRCKLLEAVARVVGPMGGVIKIEGEVTADGVRVAAGAVMLAETAPR